ncbi:MAG: hypothetical protein IH991_18580, partial [Planctomycetes bacterium]|nr:hypothetical protein [Planctomycetota bacterium]
MRASLAAALQAFPDEQQASGAALRLFQRTSNENVRRQLLFSLLESSWQDKDQILIEAFESGQGGVVAVALAAIDKTSPQLLRDRVLKLAATYAVGPPPLIDALGAVADDRASGRLEKWFEREKNAAFRLKIVLALQNIARNSLAARNSQAAQAIAKFIERESNEDVMVYLVRAAGRLKINDTQQTIINLAESADIPL